MKDTLEQNIEGNTATFSNISMQCTFCYIVMQVYICNEKKDDKKKKGLDVWSKTSSKSSTG